MLVFNILFVKMEKIGKNPIILSKNMLAYKRNNMNMHNTQIFK